MAADRHRLAVRIPCGHGKLCGYVQTCGLLRLEIVRPETWGQARGVVVQIRVSVDL